jgi:LacI family transcriptional regulator
MKSSAAVRHVAIIIDASKPYDRKVIRGVGAYAHQAGNWSLYVEEDPLQKLPDLRTWRGHGIIANFDDARVVAAVGGLEIPVVGVGGGFGWYRPEDQIPYFATDSQAIARLAATHLMERGFTRLAYCGLPATRSNGWSRIRAAAFQAAAREAGYACRTFTGRYGTARRWRELQRELSAWIVSLPKPIGLMACNDARARHVLEACRTVGVRVPEDVAVIGVDNDEVICALTDPPLSSVEQGGHRLGYQAAMVLEQMMRGRRVSRQRQYVLPEQVVSRRSTDVLAIDNADVANAVRFIRDHACEGIQVADVAATVGLSRSTLERLFQAVMRRTVHREIERIRLERAQELLRGNELTLKQIAARTGFRHITYWNRLFRQRTGWTPAAYRRSLRSTPD